MDSANREAAVRAQLKDLLEPDLVDAKWLGGVADDLDIDIVRLWYCLAMGGDHSGFSDPERERLYGYGQRWRRDEHERKQQAQRTTTTQPDALPRARFLIRLGRWTFSINREE